jgi:anti-sigma regulatory factor (Ser/Thr protein kinase)
VRSEIPFAVHAQTRSSTQYPDAVPPDEARITLSFPASPDYLRLARLATADAGSRAGFDVEEIDDLRIAVSELCNLVSRADGTGDVELTFMLSDSSVQVSGHGPGSPEGDIELSERIVEAVVDEHELTADGDGGAFALVKRRRAH